MRLIIIEDEIPAYEKLLALIGASLPEAEVLGWARSIKEGKTLLSSSEKVDLIISDIQLLDGNSFEIFEALDVQCPIIFSTAFDQYLFKAFKVNGIAYLLKPYSEESFKEAIEKYQTLFASNEKMQIDKSVLGELKALIQEEKKAYKRRFSIKKKTGIKILNVENIMSFEAQGDFCVAYDFDFKKHVINYSLGEVESKVDPDQFFRINRSEIINIDYIDKIEPHFKNRLAIKLVRRAEPVFTSSTKTPSFRVWLDK